MSVPVEDVTFGVGVGLIGYGTVGRGFVKAFYDLPKNRRDGLKIVAICDTRQSCLADFMAQYHYELTVALTTDTEKDAENVLNNPKVDIVVELIGGIEPAKSYILKALENGKSVVTANKHLLATCGEEFFQKAYEMRRGLYFEAAICGAIPIVKVMQEYIIADKVIAMQGIVNGTTNYILSRMAKTQEPFSSALEEAKRLGVAEAEPMFDISGLDAAHKLVILAQLAGYKAALSDIYVRGIEALTPADFSCAKRMGCTIKLIAQAKIYYPRLNEQIELSVEPMLIPLNNRFSEIGGIQNRIEVWGQKTCSLAFEGLGAGPLPTGAAVLSDVLNLSDQIIGAGIFNYVNTCAFPVVPPGEHRRRFLLHVALAGNWFDHSSVLRVFEARRIGIESFFRPENKAGESYFVMTTAETERRVFETALNNLRQFEWVKTISYLPFLED